MERSLEDYLPLIEMDMLMATDIVKAVQDSPLKANPKEPESILNHTKSLQEPPMNYMEQSELSINNDEVPDLDLNMKIYKPAPPGTATKST
jgi:hypothetical protein